VTEILFHFSICQEFHTIKERALKTPETSEELMEMTAFVEHSRNMGMVKLNERISESQKRLQYLLDVYFFSEEDIDLNSEVLTWPANINPIFDANDDVRS
jgi:dynein heavy chain